MRWGWSKGRKKGGRRRKKEGGKAGREGEQDSIKGKEKGDR